MKIQLSRNEREGRYAGKITSKHVRGRPVRSEHIIWPDSLCALLVERRRGVEHCYDNSKVVGIAGEFCK